MASCTEKALIKRFLHRHFEPLPCLFLLKQSDKALFQRVESKSELVTMSSASLAATGSNKALSSLHTSILAIAGATAFSYYYLTSARKPQTKSRSDPTDRLGFWQDRWSTGNTGWHKTEVHPSLQKYADENLLGDIIGGGARILVPLCGKTIDMEYLVMKRPVGEVVGVDGVPKALEEFAKEHPDLNIQPAEGVNGYGKWKGESISLLSGDFFDLDVKTAGGTFDGVWDRGSMVAIDPSLREKYVEKLGELLGKPNGRMLLSTVVRPKGDITTGPPFSIDETEVRRLFETKPWVESVELLDSHSAASQESWYKAIFMYMQMGNLQEQIYLIKTK